jgi:hypothetical protein
MVVSRNTTATRVDSAGLIESVAINVPRLDYPPLGGCPKILVEPLRTNLVFPSATLTTQTRTVTAVSHTLSFYGTGTIVLSGVHIATLTGTGANNRVTLTFTPTAGSLILTVAGTVTNAQLEAGSNATSYIPTTISALARVADVISKTGVSSLIGQTEGTLYAEVNLDNFDVNNARILAISDGTSANRIMLLTNSSNRITTIVSNSSVEQAQISSGTLTKGLYKIAVAYALNDFAFYINGALIGIDPSINVPICTDFYLGKIETSAAAGILNDRIKLAALFKTRLTEDQCKDLTT